MNLEGFKWHLVPSLVPWLEVGLLLGGDDLLLIFPAHDLDIKQSLMGDQGQVSTLVWLYELANEELSDCH